ncbi:MAG: branched-chain amino acid ABC transporter substrate-binding protein [Chloroflexi bacterium]|nr:branched-chain amino acid ABC transporter substrate-binding protein [Chloroflexota bacterium]
MYAGPSTSRSRGLGQASWGILLVTVLLVAVAAACAQPVAPPGGGGAPADQLTDEWGVITIPANGAIKVGFAAALSGPYAKLGKDIENAVKLAVEEKGTIQGIKVQVVSEDDQCEGAPSANVARKFVADDQMVGAVAHMCSGGTLAAMDIYQEKKMAMISPSSTAIDVTKKGLPIVFRTAWNDLIQGKAAADFARQKLNVKKVAIIHDKSSYGQGLAEEFQRNVKTGGVEVVALEGVSRGEKDFNAVLTKIKPNAPDLVYFGGMAAEGSQLVRQMKAQGIEAAFLSDDGLFDKKDYIEAAGGAADGTYVTYAKLPEGAQFTAWKDKFKQKFGSEIGTFSPQGYDAVNILLNAVEKVAKKQADGSLKIGRRALVEAIRATKWEGVTGAVSFDANGDRSGSIVVVNVVKGSEFQEVK